MWNMCKLKTVTVNIGSKKKQRTVGFFIYAYTQYLVSNSHECTTPSFLKLDNVIQ